MANKLKTSLEEEQKAVGSSALGAYQPGASVLQAQEKLEQQMASKPGSYQSQWQKQLNDTMQKILNREKFSYDLNGDALMQQYKDQYTQQGKKAMMDTMGKAAALTGGYGNSYAQTVGQQTYQGYLQGITDKVPELYQLALDKYKQEGNDLLNQFSLIQSQDSQDYGRYRDSVGDWENERSYLQNVYNNERNFDYGQQQDALAQQQWQAQFDEDKRRYDQEWAAEQAALAAAAASSGSPGNPAPVEELPDETPDQSTGYELLDIRRAFASAGNKADIEAAANEMVANGADPDTVFTLMESYIAMLDRDKERKAAPAVGSSLMFTKN